MPGISAPSTSVPGWNMRLEGYVESIFEFGDAYLHDDAAILLFHCDDQALYSKVEEALFPKPFLCFCNVIICYHEVCMIIYLVFHLCRSMYSCLSSQW